MSVILICLLTGIGLQAQNDSIVKIKYTPDFRFTDGLYLNFEQVRTNHPIASARIISTDDPFDINFFTNLVKNKIIGYYDAFGTKKEVQTENVWGFCRDGKLYIQYNGEFNRIPIVGSVCHFIADITVTNMQYDPFYTDYYDYYYYNSYNNLYYNRPYRNTTRTREMRQYLLDFETGKVLSFDRESVKSLLMRDTALYDEFSALRKRKQKDLMFFFIRRFNEKHPLYIPVY